MLAWAELLPRQPADGFGALQCTVGRDECTEEYLVSKYNIKGECGLNVNIQFFISLKSRVQFQNSSKGEVSGVRRFYRGFACVILGFSLLLPAFLILSG